MSKPQGVVTAGTAPAKTCLRTERHPALRWPELARGDGAERGNLGLRCERRSHKWKNHEGESTEAGHRVGSDRTDGGEVETGAGGGSAVPTGFLRVSTGEVGL